MSETITVLYGSRQVEYPAWQFNDEFSQMWEDHHAHQAWSAGIQARLRDAAARRVRYEVDAIFDSGRRAA